MLSMHPNNGKLNPVILVIAMDTPAAQAAEELGVPFSNVVVTIISPVIHCAPSRIPTIKLPRCGEIIATAAVANVGVSVTVVATPVSAIALVIAESDVVLSDGHPVTVGHLAETG